MARKIVDLSGILKDVKGNELPGAERLADYLSTSLVSESEGPALKYLDWAEELVATGTLEVDTTDFDLLKNYAENTKRVTNLVKGQILRELRKAQ